MTGVNTTVKDVKEVMGTLEEKLDLLSTTTNFIQSKLQVRLWFWLRDRAPLLVTSYDVGTVLRFDPSIRQHRGI